MPPANMPPEENSARRTSRPGLWLLLASVVAAGAGAWWWMRDDCTRWFELKNTAVGHLENNDFLKAEQALAELATKFPEDPAAVRNLAIARLLALQPQGVPGESAEAIKKNAEAALERDRKIEPESPAPYVLAAFHAAHQKDEQRAVADLDRAIELAPQDVALLYELFSVTRFASDPSIRARAVPALKRAYELDPGNLYVLTEWLGAQAESRDRTILQTLNAAKSQFSPLADNVLQLAKVKLLDLIDEAIAAAKAEKWAEVRISMIRLTGVIRPQEWVQSDLRRLRREPLAYLLNYAVHNFLPGSVCNADALLKKERVASAAVFNFVPIADANQLHELKDVRHIDLSDYDLDERPDIAVLMGKHLKLFGHAVKQQPWKLMAQLDLKAEMSGFVADDLDRDEIKTQAPRAPKKADSGAAPQPPQECQEVADAGDVPAAVDQQHERSRCNAADPDVIVFGDAGAAVFRNEFDEKSGKRSFVQVKQNAEFQALRGIVAGLLIDFDQDGDLDVVLSCETGLALWANEGDMRFQDQTKRSTLPPAAQRASALVAVDWDRDVDLDIVLSGPSGKAGYLENLRHGQFRWREFEGKLSELKDARSLNLLDADANGAWDLVACGGQGALLVTTVAPSAAGAVAGLDSHSITKTPVKRGVIWDFDNDSYADLAGCGKEGLSMFRGTIAGRFEAVASGLPSVSKPIHVCAAADLDGDGDGDLVAAGPDGMVLFDNATEHQNHWLDVRIRGENATKGGRVNHSGRGSLLELKAGPLYCQQVVSGTVTHFGLGSRKSVDVVRVLWTNGVPQTVIRPEPDRVICEVHDPKGSCPFVYTWNGNEFEFYTDLLWGAPMGLQFAEGVYAQPRAWEYLKIDGDRLRPKGGKYVLQITEELWEAAYFDCVRLIAVDHPADVEIYSNEKVGPPDVAAHKIHTVKSRRTPIAARDQRGRDVLEEVRRRDGVYMQGFDRSLRQGLTEEHFLELDLGNLAAAPADNADAARNITLFLTGWIYPTDTSLNVAISQNPRMPRPRPPALWVPDAQGAWKEVRPFMGFPGGKTKTIAVDLSGLFTKNDHRLRIVTNMEFRWDEAFFTVGETPAPFKLHPLTMKAADLHYRGFSAPRRDPGLGPTTFDYNSVRTAPQWPPMRGAFTRYGPVTELLTTEDDRFAVLGSGDEITLEFDVPAAPPAGWKRDFLLYNSGWDKDADLHTIYGQDVEPLPFQAMSGYPYAASEAYPDDPLHHEYLRQYQTRRQPAADFWRMLMRE